MGTWFLLVVLLISSTASLENVTACVLKDPGMHFISLGNRTVLTVGENANVSCMSGYQIVPNIYAKRAYEYDYRDSVSTADASEMPETEDNENLVPVRDVNYTCRDNGKWEPEIRFSCKQIICDSLYGYNLENGHIFYSSRYPYTVDTVASFLCNPGYIRHGPETRKCQVDGTWAGECVTCQRSIRNPSITCPAPCVPEGARKTGSQTYEIGSRVDFHCPRSKSQDRDDRSRFKYCIKRGEYASWKGTKINCKEIICDKGDHYGFENGKVTYSSSVPTVGTKAVFMCNPGYNRSGPMTRICQKDGTWSRGCVTCQKHQHNWSTCPAPCVPDGAKRIGPLSYELGSRIQFYCFQSNMQYKVDSRYIRHCVNDSKSASWNGTNINCKAKCETLTDTYNVVQTGIVPGILSDKTVMEVSCSRSLPTVQAMCRNGHWYPQKPTCEDRCFIEPTINLEYFIGHEKVLESYIHRGILMHARCSNQMELFRSYSYLEKEQVSVKCYLGKLEPASLVCKDKRCNITITAIENGHFRNGGNVIVAGEKIDSGSNITFVCFDGYELFNESISKYLESEKADILCYQGSFTVAFPKCKPKRCNITITTIENGQFRNGGNVIVAGEKIDSGSNITFVCFYGYKLFNESTSKYLESEKADILCYQGSFTVAFPKCKPSMCTVDPVDVVFVLDSSATMLSAGFESEKVFVKQFTDLVEIGEKQFHIGVVQFDHEGYIEFNLTAYFDKTSIKNAVQKIDYLSRGTDIAAGLSKANDVLNQTRRSIAVMYVVVLTDETLSSIKDKAFSDADKLKSNPALRILVIGIGVDANSTEDLKKIASSPSYFLYVNKTAELAAVLTSTVNITCQDIKDCASSPCQNGGICETTQSGYSCKCPYGYIGVRCQDYGECIRNLCFNNGTCYQGRDVYYCMCVPGYTGSRCETNYDDCSSNPCKHNATCIDSINGYTCSCVPGYVGVNCETDYNECASSPCQNGGTCVDFVNFFQCRCPSGFSEDLCETG